MPNNEPLDDLRSYVAVITERVDAGVEPPRPDIGSTVERGTGASRRGRWLVAAVAAVSAVALVGGIVLLDGDEDGAVTVAGPDGSEGSNTGAQLDEGDLGTNPDDLPGEVSTGCGRRGDQLVAGTGWQLFDIDSEYPAYGLEIDGEWAGSSCHDEHSVRALEDGLFTWNSVRRGERVVIYGELPATVEAMLIGDTEVSVVPNPGHELAPQMFAVELTGVGEDTSSVSVRITDTAPGAPTSGYPTSLSIAANDIGALSSTVPIPSG